MSRSEIKATKFTFSVLLITGIVFLAFFAIVEKSFGALPPNQIQYSSSTDINDTAIQNLGSGWTGTVSGISVLLKATGNGDSLLFGEYLGGCPAQVDSSKPYRSILLPEISTSSPYYFDFDDSLSGYTGDFSLNSTTTYAIQLVDNNGVGKALRSDSSVYPYGDLYRQKFISGSWNCFLQSGDLFFLTNTTSTPALTGSIEVLFPEDGMTMPDFTNWVLGLSNLEANNVYYGVVEYYPTNATGTLLQEYYYQDFFSVNTETSSLIWATPKFQKLPDDPTSTIGYYDSWTAFAELFSDMNYIFGVGASPAITFTPDRSSSDPTSTYAGLAGPFINPPIVASRAECDALGFSSVFSSSGLQTIGCYLSNAFLDSIDAMGDLLTSIMNAGANKLFAIMRTIFPFREISAFNDIINDVQEATSTYSVSLAGAGLWGGHTFNIINASSSSWIEEEMGFDYRGFISKILNVLTIVIVLLTTIKILKGTHDSATLK